MTFEEWLQTYHSNYKDQPYALALAQAAYEAGRNDLADEIYNKCIGRDFAHLSVIDAIVEVREAERKAVAEECISLVRDIMQSECYKSTCGSKYPSCSDCMIAAIRDRFVL